MHSDMHMAAQAAVRADLDVQHSEQRARRRLAIAHPALIHEPALAAVAVPIELPAAAADVLHIDCSGRPAACAAGIQHAAGAAGRVPVQDRPLREHASQLASRTLSPSSVRMLLNPYISKACGCREQQEARQDATRCDLSARAIVALLDI